MCGSVLNVVHGHGNCLNIRCSKKSKKLPFLDLVAFENAIAICTNNEIFARNMDQVWASVWRNIRAFGIKSIQMFDYRAPLRAVRGIDDLVGPVFIVVDRDLRRSALVQRSRCRYGGKILERIDEFLSLQIRFHRYARQSAFDASEGFVKHVELRTSIRRDDDVHLLRLVPVLIEQKAAR
jgi:hypothetical protein